MLVSLNITQPPVGGDGPAILGWNSEQITDYNVNQPFMDLARNGRYRAASTGGEYDLDWTTPRDATTGLPSELPTGYPTLKVLWAYGSDVGTEVTGNYVIRHNLPGDYTITVGGTANNQVNVSSTRITFTLPSVNYFEITISNGSDGALPAGWTFEVFKAEHEALIDDTNLPALDARRLFRPEYLSLLASTNPAEWRVMNWNYINSNTERIYDVADMVKWTDNWFTGLVPIEWQVALCNYLGCDLYWNQWFNSTDALIDHCATYIRDNLDPSLKCIVEYGNEIWNTMFKGWQYASGIGLARPFGPGTAGVGTVSASAGSTTITGVGTDFVSEFSGLPAAYLAADGVMYQVDMATLTATTATIRYGQTTLRGFSGVNWHRNTDSNPAWNLGNAILATNVATRFQNIFNATGERDRLVNAVGINLDSVGIDYILAADGWAEDPLYVDPSTVFDTVVNNVYLGSGWKFNETLKQEFIDLYNASNQQGWNTLFKQLAFETHPTYQEEGLPSMVNDYKRQKTKADTFGLDLRIYESGYHFIHSMEVIEETTILQPFLAYLESTENVEVLDEWFSMIRTYSNGPVVTYKFMGNHYRWGTWGIYKNYTHSDGRTAWYENVRDTVEPWWDTAYAPVQTRTVPAQSWTQGVDPNFSIYDYVSTNVTSYSGTVPSGMTLNTSTGVLTGAPNTTGNNDFSVTASNATGNVVVNVSVTVS